MINIAFVGNPNVGKTALINNISNASLKIGNWPGVTIEKKEVFFKINNDEVKLIDLPGIYNLSVSICFYMDHKYGYIAQPAKFTCDLFQTRQFRLGQRRILREIAAITRHDGVGHRRPANRLKARTNDTRFSNAGSRRAAQCGSPCLVV